MKNIIIDSTETLTLVMLDLYKQSNEEHTLIFAPGNYDIPQLIIACPAKLVSEKGPEQTNLQFTDLPLNILGEGNTIQIQGFTFSNISSSNGRAIELFNDNILYLENCVFKNAAGICSGALLVWGSAHLIATRCLFRENEAEMGAGIALGIGATGFVDRCYFQGNKAVVGGAISVEDEAKLLVRQSTFEQNSAEHPKGGKAFFVRSAIHEAPKITCVNSLFLDDESFINVTERKEAMEFSHCLFPPEALDGLECKDNQNNLAAIPKLEKVQSGLVGLALDSPGKGMADISEIEPDTLDLLGNPLVVSNKTDPGAIAFIKK